MKTLSINKILLSLVILTASVFAVQAQKGDPNLDSRKSHFFTAHITGGASSYTMMPSYGSVLSDDANFDNAVSDRAVVLHPDSLHINPFLGATFGLGYEYQGPRGGWFNIGLEAQYTSGELHHTDSLHRIEQVMDGNVETGQKPADVEYTIIRWNERQSVLSVQLPIVGGYKHQSGFYFGVGVKAGFTLYNVISGDFGFADCNLDYEENPEMNQIKKDVPLDSVVSSDNNFVYRPQLSPMIEVGWQGFDMEITKKHRMRFKFALVGEVGLLSAYNNQNSADDLFDYSKLDGFRLEDLEEFFQSVNSFYSTIPLGMSQSQFDGLRGEGKFENFKRPATLHSWYIGVKVGVMLEMPKRKDCNCLNNNVTKPWLKNRKERGVE